MRSGRSYGGAWAALRSGLAGQGQEGVVESGAAQREAGDRQARGCQPGGQVGEDGRTVADLQDDLPGRVDGGRCGGQWRYGSR